MTFKQPTKFELFLQKYFPLIFSLLIISFSYAPLHISGLFFVKPQLILILIYFWAVNYCEDFSYGSVILCGLLEDVLDASFFGVNTFCYLLFFYFTTMNRRFIAWKDFTYSWIGFLILSLLIMTLKWVLVCVNSSAIIGFGSTFFSWMLLGLLFPPIFIVTYKLYDKVLGSNK